MRLLYFIIYLAFLISCHSNEGKAIVLSGTTSFDSLPIKKTQKPTVQFDNHKPFEIANAIRGITTVSSSPDTNMCKGWTLTTQKAAQIIKNAEPIDGTRWDLEFLVLPCIVEGQIRQEGQLYKYEINSASWISVTSADTTQYYGSYKKENEKYFLEKANDEK